MKIDLSSALSRRDFLKLTGYGMLSLLLPDMPLLAAQPQAYLKDQQGRVTDDLLWTYSQPSFESKRLKMYWRDIIVPITGATISEDQEAHNRIWYELGDDGFAYSGAIQPVHTLLNQPLTGIPADGLLGEISVPYTDALEAADPTAKVSHRLYYETVHWIMEAVTGADGNIWYRLLEDKYNTFYYIPARHIRVIPERELAPLSTDVPASRKKIEVYLERQLVLAYENGRLVFASRASTGRKVRAGKWDTPTGHFMTYYKRPTRHMAAGDIASNGFDLPGVPWVLYITQSGISFHGTYWHNDYGRPRSHGCINLTPQAAKWLYRWTMPVVAPDEQYAYEFSGTAVEIIE
ncbi:MAG: hypothetical protein Kow002_17160 [Anaerolineales bacterium]